MRRIQIPGKGAGSGGFPLRDEQGNLRMFSSVLPSLSAGKITAGYHNGGEGRIKVGFEPQTVLFLNPTVAEEDAYIYSLHSTSLSKFASLVISWYSENNGNVSAARAQSEITFTSDGFVFVSKEPPCMWIAIG